LLDGRFYSANFLFMKTVNSLLKKTIVVLLIIGVVFVLVEYYSYIFSRTVVGRIDNVQRVTGVTAMFGNRPLTDGQLHMFSVSIRQPNGEMVTAISEDAQWAIARAGLCVKANYYPYPPWNLKQAGTYFNARLLTMVDCGSQAARDIGIDPANFANAPISSGPGPETPADVPHDLPATPPSMEQQPSGTEPSKL
jgi:hypothetical protein